MNAGAEAAHEVTTATVSVTVDNEREVAAVNAWFQRWGPRIQCADNQGCGCCVDIWDVRAPAAALAELPRGVWQSPSSPK